MAGARGALPAPRGAAVPELRIPAPSQLRQKPEGAKSPSPAPVSWHGAGSRTLPAPALGSVCSQPVPCPAGIPGSCPSGNPSAHERPSPRNLGSQCPHGRQPRLCPFLRHRPVPSWPSLAALPKGRAQPGGSRATEGAVTAAQSAGQPRGHRPAVPGLPCHQPGWDSQPALGTMLPRDSKHGTGAVFRDRFHPGPGFPAAPTAPGEPGPAWVNINPVLTQTLHAST